MHGSKFPLNFSRVAGPLEWYPILRNKYDYRRFTLATSRFTTGAISSHSSPVFIFYSQPSLVGCLSWYVQQRCLSNKLRTSMRDKLPNACKHTHTQTKRDLSLIAIILVLRLSIVRRGDTGARGTKCCAETFLGTLAVTLSLYNVTLATLYLTPALYIPYSSAAASAFETTYKVYINTKYSYTPSTSLKFRDKIPHTPPPVAYFLYLVKKINALKPSSTP